ncbi:RnfABCDGE type electron transport complex subunit B [Amphritea balenae]|uniref:Ion-translocating oxidoreductase complex subunit B n=1 Tax=Amphritea balenae TaxID=452629 RepID=A0A3P1SLX8_9GAMM|nr:RnfABCDGE type electron transport complex subunit B [Amphritea balenae]RRC98020.1 RnfABCDGE type electron transport complex subunit B [Amphritea balenae]GGK66858.1 electron transport complex subunit B [Amphritea balenae]
MISSILILTLIGTVLGLMLSAVDYFLPYKEDPQIAQITELLPGTQCGQCGYAGCSQAAAALINGNAPLTLCPPGGPSMARQLSETLGRPLEQQQPATPVLPSLAKVVSELCIGCTKCIQECPTDAIVGAPKQLHVVLNEACNGCGACVDACPTEGILLAEMQLNLSNWRWSKPPGPNPFRVPMTEMGGAQ